MMSLETKKLEMVQRLLMVESEDILDRVRELLETAREFSLSDAQKAALDAQDARYRSGSGTFKPLDESISHIRDKYKADHSE